MPKPIKTNKQVDSTVLSAPSPSLASMIISPLKLNKLPSLAGPPPPSITRRPPSPWPEPAASENPGDFGVPLPRGRKGSL